jgi:hypothetical protein
MQAPTSVRHDTTDKSFVAMTKINRIDAAVWTGTAVDLSQRGRATWVLSCGYSRFGECPNGCV